MLRPDLYFRLAAMKITLPPLRQRGEDILMLFTQFGEQFAEEYGCDAPQVTAQEAAQLLQAPWPGNIRQLINVAERAVLQNRRGSGTIASLLMAENDDAQPAMTTEGKPLKEYVEAFERMLIDNTMRRHKGSIVDGDGRAVPAAPDAEREDGEIRVAAVGLFVIPDQAVWRRDFTPASGLRFSQSRNPLRALEEPCNSILPSAVARDSAISPRITRIMSGNAQMT